MYKKLLYQSKSKCQVQNKRKVKKKMKIENNDIRKSLPKFGFQAHILFLKPKNQILSLN